MRKKQLWHYFEKLDQCSCLLHYLHLLQSLGWLSLLAEKFLHLQYSHSPHSTPPENP